MGDDIPEGCWKVGESCSDIYFNAEIAMAQPARYEVYCSAICIVLTYPTLVTDFFWIFY